MCSDYQQNFSDFLSGCSVRSLPYNITEDQLSSHIQYNATPSCLRVNVLIWDATQGWLLCRYFPYDECALEFIQHDPEHLQQTIRAIIQQLQKTVTGMITDHPAELLDLIRQIHALQKM